MAKTGEFLHEIEDTLDRRADNGDPWCPEHARGRVELWVTTRDLKFFNALIQMVRLVRAMQLADEVDYVAFLYLRFDTLRETGFARAFLAPASRRRLAGRIEVDKTGLRFLEPALWLPATEDEPARPFDLAFAQMPALAALLDVLHSGLGFEPVATLLQAVTQPVPADPIASVRGLRQAWDAWMKGRAQSEHFGKKAAALRERLDPTRTPRYRAVDDAFILNAWRVLSTGELDGFRTLRSTARTSIRLRQAIRISENERQLQSAKSFGGADEPGAVDLDRLEARALDTSNWTSPLPVLVGTGDNPIKWFRNKEEDLKFLDDHLGASEAGEDIDAQGGSLSGPEPYDFELGLTLMRCMMFGPLQQRMTERMKRGGYAGPAEWEAATVLPDAGYGALRARYGDLLANADRVCRAAAAILLRHGGLASLELLAEDPDPGVQAWIAGLREAAGGDATAEKLEDADLRGNVVDLYDRTGLLGAVNGLALALGDVRAAPEHLQPVVRVLRAATDKFERSGFSPADRTRPEVIAALGAGVEVVTRYRNALRSAIDWCAAAQPDRMFAEDRRVALDHLRAMYLDADP